MSGWDVQIGDYDPVLGPTMEHHIGSGLASQIGGTAGGETVAIRRNPIRKDDTSRPLRSGAIARRPDLLSSIYVNVPVLISTATMQEAEAELDAILYGWRPRTLPAWLYVTDPSGQRYAYRGKPRDAQQDEKNVRSGLIGAQFLFEATHPFRFGQDLNTVNLLGGVGGGGITFPFGFPFGFGTPLSSGTTICTNNGTAETWPIYRFIPITEGVGPLIVRDNARDIEWRWDGSLNLGTQLWVDMGEGIVFTAPGSPFTFFNPITGLAPDVPMDAIPVGGTLASSFVHRPGSDWISLPPGDTALGFSAQNGACVLQVISRDLWYR